MADWIDFERWAECVNMERPGIMFEIEAADGRRLRTLCEVPLALPEDWKAKPVRFRVIETPKPRHSDPIPRPSGG